MKLLHLWQHCLWRPNKRSPSFNYLVEPCGPSVAVRTHSASKTHQLNQYHTSNFFLTNTLSKQTALFFFFSFFHHGFPASNHHHQCASCHYMYRRIHQCETDGHGSCIKTAAKPTDDWISISQNAGRTTEYALPNDPPNGRQLWFRYQRCQFESVL